MSHKTLSINKRTYDQLVIFASKEAIKIKKPVSLGKAIGILLQRADFNYTHRGLLDAMGE